MLTKKELEKIIAAWPDENGKSSDPETYAEWKQLEGTLGEGGIINELCEFDRFRAAKSDNQKLN